MLPLEKAPYILLAAFYVFNMQYMSGCTNVFSFLEYLFVDVPVPKRRHFSIFNIA